MSKDKDARGLSRADYEAARRGASRDEPPVPPALCDRPPPSATSLMTPAEYSAAKRAISARN